MAPWPHWEVWPIFMTVLLAHAVTFIIALSVHEILAPTHLLSAHNSWKHNWSASSWCSGRFGAWSTPCRLKCHPMPSCLRAVLMAKCWAEAAMLESFLTHIWWPSLLAASCLWGFLIAAAVCYLQAAAIGLWDALLQLWWLFKEGNTRLFALWRRLGGNS